MIQKAQAILAGLASIFGKYHGKFWRDTPPEPEARIVRWCPKSFALEVIKVCNEIKRSKRESVLTNQLIRSGTSIGANIREAFYGHGRSDFIAKLQIALKECSESEYWLELLIESNYYSDTTVLEHCIEMKKLLISSLNTAKKNTK